MSSKRSIIYAGFFFTVMLFNSQVFAQESKKEITLTGIVEAYVFDENDNVKQIAISVERQIDEYNFEFVNYLVVNEKKGRELFQYIGNTVKVTGTYTVDKNGNYLLTVSSYMIMDTEDKVDLDIDDEDLTE